MELNLTFRNLGRSKIPIDYHYHLGSWIYHILSEADQEYADFLHNEGCHVSENDQRAYKLFCASRLGFSRYEITDNHSPM
jgi:CRISPR-associated endoribonuclease Cas6